MRHLHDLSGLDLCPSERLTDEDGELCALLRLQSSLSGCPSVGLYDRNERTLVSLISNTLANDVLTATCSAELDELLPAASHGAREAFARFLDGPPGRRGAFDETFALGDGWVCLFLRWARAPEKIVIIVCAGGPIACSEWVGEGRAALRALARKHP